MLKLYYLSTCDTCARIMKELKLKKYPFTIQDIKTEKITPQQLEDMKTMAGSYEALFSRIALKFRGWGLNKMTLSEKDYRKYILEEYTFLKRPVFIMNDQIFIGNAPKTVEAVKEALKNL